MNHPEGQSKRDKRENMKEFEMKKEKEGYKQ
jgi:hypothetical protein